jgi:hypothetical protein
MKFMQYFAVMRQRPDRSFIKDEWIMYAMQHPLREAIQADGRIRRWAKIAEMDDRVLRIVLLPGGETVHNAFFDRTFRE